MSSPSGSKNGYVPLEDSVRPRPKPSLSKTISTPGIPPPLPPKPRTSSFSSELPPPSFFTSGSGGGSSCGYYVSSAGVHKPKRSESSQQEGEHDTTPIDINHSPFAKKSRSLHGLRFKSDKTESGSSRPKLAALPAKFRAAFEEGKKKTKQAPPSNELQSASLPDIGSDLSYSIERRPPSLIDIDIDIPGLTKSLESVGSAKSEEREETKSPGAASIVTSACLQLPMTFAQPAPRELTYTEADNTKHTFDKLNRLRKEGHLCDITLLGSSDIQAHKIVLAAVSTYFEGMFIGENSVGDQVFIEEIDEEMLPFLVDFAYTSQITITDRNVYPLFEAADVLGITGVKSACCKFLKLQMNKSNCISTWLFAKEQNSAELMDAALHYIESNFLDIARGREFLKLDRPEVVAKIASLEEIAITSEEQVYEAVLGWVTYDLERRKPHAPEVFGKVRFPSMSRDFLLHIVDHEPVIREDPDLLQQLIDALECHVSTVRSTLRKKLKKKASQAAIAGLEPRHSSMAVEMVNVEANDGLGIKIMGGKDRPTHVFRQGDKPGIFILETEAGNAASRHGRLRVGDRIITINSQDVSNATHEHAASLLQATPLSILVRHEAPPTGLCQVTLVTKPGEGFGFSICGGVNAPLPGNPHDETDEGIFISQIVSGGAAEQESQLVVGSRILQVNSQSLLGRTHAEVLATMQGVLDRMQLLICRGYNPPS